MTKFEVLLKLVIPAETKQEAQELAKVAATEVGWLGGIDIAVVANVQELK